MKPLVTQHGTVKPVLTDRGQPADGVKHPFKPRCRYLMPSGAEVRFVAVSEVWGQTVASFEYVLPGTKPGRRMGSGDGLDLQRSQWHLPMKMVMLKAGSGAAGAACLLTRLPRVGAVP